MYIYIRGLKFCIDVVLYFNHTRIFEVNDVISNNDIVILTLPLRVVNGEHFQPCVMFTVHPVTSKSIPQIHQHKLMATENTALIKLSTGKQSALFDSSQYCQILCNGS